MDDCQSQWCWGDVSTQEDLTWDYQTGKTWFNNERPAMQSPAVIYNGKPIQKNSYSTKTKFHPVFQWFGTANDIILCIILFFWIFQVNGKNQLTKAPPLLLGDLLAIPPSADGVISLSNFSLFFSSYCWLKSWPWQFTFDFACFQVQFCTYFIHKWLNHTLVSIILPHDSWPLQHMYAGHSLLGFYHVYSNWAAIVFSPVQFQGIQSSPVQSSPVDPVKEVILIKDKLLSVRPYWAC